MKKLAALALVLACIMGLIGCNAQNYEQDISANVKSKADVMMEMTQVYLKTVLELEDTSCVLGNQLSAYRLSSGKLEPSDYEIYPVFVENEVVAFTTCFLNDSGEYIVGSGVDYAGSFWQEYSEQPDTPVAIVYAHEGVYLVREGETPIILDEMPVSGCDPIEELDHCRSLLVYAAI